MTDPQIVALLRGGAESESGESVTASSALTFSAVWACVRVLSESVGSLPLILYQRLSDGGRERATDAPLYPLLHSAPNPDMTSVTYRETCMVHLCTWGNSYSEIIRDGAGRVRQLWPLDPSQMSVERNEGGEIVYKYWDRGRQVPYPRKKIFHVLGLGSDGLVGMNQVDLMRNEIGLGLTLNKHGSRTFKNGARPGVVLEHPGHLTDQASKNLATSFDAAYSGSNIGKTAVLEEGMKLSTFGFPNESAQFLESRKFQIEEVARMYRVPPHMIGDLDRATFSNIEQMSLEFVSYTLAPWLVRIEQAVSLQLMTPAEQKQYFAEFLIDALLRGDTQSRYQAYATGRQNGWMSANDIRVRENMNPYPGGEVYLIPLNMIPAGQAGQQALAPAAGAPTTTRALTSAEQRAAVSLAGRRRLITAYTPMFEDVLGRIVRREQHDIRDAVKKHLGQRAATDSFDAWLKDFYIEHRDFVRKQVTPLYRSYSEAVAGAAQDEIAQPVDGAERVDGFTTSYVNDFAERYSNIQYAQMLDAMRVAEGGDVGGAVKAQLEQWDNKPKDQTRWETNRFNNALAVLVFNIAGKQILRWHNFGDSCPYCRHLNGKTSRITEWFLTPGDFKPDGADRPLVVSQDIRHPPAHGGCDCMVSAA